MFSLMYKYIDKTSVQYRPENNASCKIPRITSISVPVFIIPISNPIPIPQIPEPEPVPDIQLDEIHIDTQESHFDQSYPNYSPRPVSRYNSHPPVKFKFTERHMNRSLQSTSRYIGASGNWKNYPPPTAKIYSKNELRVNVFRNLINKNSSTDLP